MSAVALLNNFSHTLGSYMPSVVRQNGICVKVRGLYFFSMLYSLSNGYKYFEGMIHDFDPAQLSVLCTFNKSLSSQQTSLD